MTDLDAAKEAMRKCVGADSVLSDDRVLDMLARAALSSQSLSLSEAREEIERLKGLLHTNGKPRFNEAMRRLESAEAEKDRLKAALDYLAENTSRSLAFDGKWDCEDDNSDLWIITEVQGGINDREWVLIGSGKTPAEALLDAAPALENGPAGLADATNDPADSDLSSLREGDGTTYPRLSSLRKDAVGPAVSEGGRGHSAPVTSGAEVAVKPLEWNEYEREGAADQWDAEAGSFHVYYGIELHHDGYRAFWDGEALGPFESLEAAKSAAQSDFETRIRSALVSGSREDGE